MLQSGMKNMSLVTTICAIPNIAVEKGLDGSAEKIVAARL